jgi:orotidine-5'-phosphate decarboxylase
MKIGTKKSIVVACDFASMSSLERVVSKTFDLDGVGGYKIGFGLALRYGLPSIVDSIRTYTNKPVIYDHQKGGTDVPHTGAIFAEIMVEAKADYTILFPFSGPSTEIAWIEALLKKGIIPIVGAVMTIPDFLKKDGGHIDEGSALRIFDIAASHGVRDFVLPGNKPDIILDYMHRVEKMAPSSTYFLPGLGTQGGDIQQCAKVMGENWHAIVGRSIYEAKDVRAATLSLINGLLLG